MPRITDERREENRRRILDAARRCFARDGFHQTSMPDIAREAGLSTGAFYRYYPSKDDVVLEVAGQAFSILAGRLDEAVTGDAAPTVADLVTAVVGTFGAERVRVPDGSDIDLDELVRCGVQAWGEATRPGALQDRVQRGFGGLRDRVTTGLRRGQEAGLVPVALTPESGAHVVMAVIPGFVMQRAVFGYRDVDGFVAAVHTLLGAPDTLRTASPGLSQD
ncbi:TetR/AcrR family transcriptional regulator [Actinomycetospora sp. CA-084318]|uniref:TetR/AcrR family transcriptional regulator n=1 Tax=Actinomycetospora sp. CA-084318 TaxID=3239892 RepID=UPI003D983D2A